MKEVIQENLDYSIKTMSKDCVWLTKHRWGQFEDVFEKTSKQEWVGPFSIDILNTLKSFGRMDFN